MTSFGWVFLARPARKTIIWSYLSRSQRYINIKKVRGRISTSSPQTLVNKLNIGDSSLWSEPHVISYLFLFKIVELILTGSNVSLFSCSQVEELPPPLSIVTKTESPEPWKSHQDVIVSKSHFYHCSSCWHHVL